MTPPQTPETILYEQRKLATQEQIGLFEEALEEIDTQDVSLLPKLYQAFDDGTEEHEVMWGLLHVVEAFALEPGVRTLIEATPGLLQQAPEWAKTLYSRMFNEDQAALLLQQVLETSSPELQNSVQMVLAMLTTEKS
jgi:hypothetical protein